MDRKLYVVSYSQLLDIDDNSGVNLDEATLQ